MYAKMLKETENGETRLLGTPIFETKYTENGRENKTVKVILEMAVIYRIYTTTKIFPNLFAIMR